MYLKTFTWTQCARMSDDQMDFFSLASTPNEENCTAAGQSKELQLMECRAYINQLIRENGAPPQGAEFFIIENSHEFGTYWEAGIWFVPTKPDEEEQSESEEYAGRQEIGPDKWDNVAKQELRRAGHPDYQHAKIIELRKTA